MATTTKTFEIPVPNMAKLEQRVARLARRSKRLGCEPVVLAKVADAQRMLRRDASEAAPSFTTTGAAS